MEIEGTINGGRIEFDVDTDDIKQELEIMDTDDVEQYINDYLDNHDWTSQINVDDQVEALLDVYEGNPSPCSIGQIFEKAVWWAVTRREESKHAPREVVVASDEVVVASDNEIRRIVREELLAVMHKGLDRNV